MGALVVDGRAEGVGTTRDHGRLVVRRRQDPQTVDLNHCPPYERTVDDGGLDACQRPRR